MGGGRCGDRCGAGRERGVVGGGAVEGEGGRRFQFSTEGHDFGLVRVSAVPPTLSLTVPTPTTHTTPTFLKYSTTVSRPSNASS